MDLIIVAVGAAVVIWVEKSQMAQHAHTVPMVVVGLVFAAPFLIALLILRAVRDRGTPKSPPARRPGGYRFGGPR